MIPPKYEFYIAKLAGATLKPDTGINIVNGEFESDNNYYATNIISLGDYNSVLIDLSTSDNINIYWYDSSKSYIYNSSVIADRECVIAPNDEFADRVKYFAIKFYKGEAFMARKDSDIVYVAKAITPHYKSLSKKYAKESGQEFFRISLEGKITIFGKDYDIVKNSSLEDNLLMFIYKLAYGTASSTGVKYKIQNEYYRGEFNKTDCTLDYSKKSCELKITTLDAYNEVMNKYENTYDLIKLAPEITKIDLYKRSLMQVYIQGANSITNFFGGICWESDVNGAVDDYNALVNTYYFAYLKSANEFAVKGSSILEINGVYAGTNGDWQCWSGYSAYAVQTDLSQGYLFIKRNSDNKALYVSKLIRIRFDTDNTYISPGGDIVLTAIEGNGVVTGTCTVYNIFAYHIFQRLLCDVDTVEDSGGVKSTYDLPVNDFVSDNRNYKKCIGLVGGMFFCTSRAVDEPTKYGLNDYGQYFTNKFIPPSLGIERVLPISRNSWANASLWYAYSSFYEIFEPQLRKKYTLKNSYSIAAAIKVLLKEIDPTLTHEATAEYSHFLYDTNAPLNMTRFYVFITQKTNILKGEYDQPAQKAEISLKEITEMLRDCFRCYWYIEDGKFKIEHIYFFMNGGSYSNSANIQLDFTKLVDQFNKRPTHYFQSEIEYDKSELNQRYEFGWMDDVTDLFDGLYIDIKSNYIQKDKTEEITVNQFSSDIDYMLFNPSGFSEDGFALLCPIANGSAFELPIVKTRLIDENGDSYNATVQNWYAAWAYLTITFYIYDMPAYNAKCNVLQYMPVNSIKRCMKHTIEFPSEEDPDELQLIKTQIGDGKIDEISVNIDTRLTQTKLLYTPK